MIKRVASDWIAVTDNEARNFHFSLITALVLITANSELAPPTDLLDLLSFHQNTNHPFTLLIV